MSSPPREISLALHPATIGWRVPWPGLAHLAAEAGYHGAVLPRDEPLSFDPEPSPPVPATAMQLPVEVRQDEAAFANTFPRLRKACEFASRLGCRVALLGIPPSSEQPRFEQARTYRERLKRCCAVLDVYSIRLALECITPLHSRNAHPYEFIWHNAEMLDFGLSVSPNIGLIVDSWHWHHAGARPEWISGVPDDRILDVHVSDSPRAAPEDIRDSKRCLPGQGAIDFKVFLELLADKNYLRPLSVEIFGGLEELTPDDAARAAYAACHTTFAKAGS